MKPSRKVTTIAAALLAICLFSTIVLLHNSDRTHPQASLEEALYVPSPKVVKRLSLGYDGLLADIYWTRVVQYFGGKRHAGSARYDLLAPLLEITTTLDPHLLVAYEFGGNFLAPSPPEGAGEPQEAIELAEAGIRNNPNEWRLYYNLGFVYYAELKDYSKAAEAFQRGSKIPNAHPFLKILAATMAQRGGDVQTARMMWTTTYETIPDKMIRANAVAHLRALQVDEEVGALQSLVSQYELANGKPPQSFEDLVRANLLRGIPVDPLGLPYVLTGDGRVEVSDPDRLPFIKLGKPLGYVPPPLSKTLPPN